MEMTYEEDWNEDWNEYWNGYLGYGYICIRFGIISSNEYNWRINIKWNRRTMYKRK